MSPNPLHGIPSVHELLENPRLKRLVERIHPGAVLATVRAVLEEVTSEVHAAATERTWPSVTELAERIARRVMASDPPGLRPVINATGVVFHPELGPPPLADRVIEAMDAASREYLTPTGSPADHGDLAGRLLAELTGAEAALVVSSPSAATMLALAASGDDGEIVLGLAHMIRRTADHNLPALCRVTARVLREVGAVNHTTLDDYAEALGQWASAVWVVESPWARRAGVVCPTLAELVELARQKNKNLPVVHDLGPASILDLAPFGLADVPRVGPSVATGASVVLFGAEMLGGPPCGILVGQRDALARMAAHPMAAPLRATSAVLAGLAAALQLHKEPEQARLALPALQLTTTSPDNLAGRARRLAEQMAGCGAIAAAEPVETTVAWGGDVFPGSESPTWGISLRGSSLASAQLAEGLRNAQPSVIARAAPDHVLLDLRSVPPRHDLSLVQAVQGLDSAARPERSEEPRS
ncbi:MAG: hypothetical protein JW809_10165 [Pirellulales bacterium]|nr:hypothetical protein [Pirellulales bacterium]